MAPIDRERTASPPAPSAMPMSAPASAAPPRASPARGFFGAPLDRAAECARACRGARRPERPDHEGGAAARHHSRCAAAGIRQRADQAAEPGAADGLGLRQAAHERRTRRRLAEEIRRVRASPGGGRLARPGASRHARSMAASLPASCNIPTCSRRSKPTSASCNCCSRSASASIRRSIPARSPVEIGARAARGARLCARGQARRALSRRC